MVSITRTCSSYLVVLWLLRLLLSSTLVLGATDFIPCFDPCNGGDVNYELTASVRTMKMLNYTYRGRTYSKEGDESFMGPTLRVQPGQSLWIKLVNNMTEEVGPRPPTPTDYWEMMAKPGEFIKYQRYKKRVSDPSLLKVDYTNLPHNFESTNLHLHGLDIDVHMFDPVGTHNPDAPHISVDPGECYCYKFSVPDHHPGGMYWYHPHVHGSSAVQIWGGMLGLVYVEGPLLDELADYGITNSQEFVIWDPAFKAVQKPTHNLEVDDFLLGQTTLSKIHPFTVNGLTNAHFTVEAGEVLHLRTLCGTIENENTFIVFPEGMEGQHWEELALPFYRIASDGVTYRKPRKQKVMVLAGGQREEILVQIDEPGRYVISQQDIEGFQFFGMRGHPHNQVLATITVTEATTTNKRPTMPISEMEFTPGYDETEDIQPEDIVGSETIIFSMGANLDQVPFPQYYINGRPFDPEHIGFTAHPGEAREYILINANHNAHPFHIHVNRFQVQEMGSELAVADYRVVEPVLDYEPGMWRDTVMVPPNGRTRIWVQYKNYTGKTVLHCHFLAHEDTGMMATLFIGEKDWVFRWHEHQQWLLGGCAGLVLGIMAMLIVWTRRASSRNDEYTAVSMNELKSKTVD